MGPNDDDDDNDDDDVETDGVAASTLSKAGGRDDGLAVSSVKLVKLRLVAADSQNLTLIGRPPPAAAAAGPAGGGGVPLICRGRV